MEAQLDLVDRKELVRRSGVSQSTVKRWARTGVGPTPIKIGPRVIRYQREEVEAWLAGRVAA